MNNIKSTNIFALPKGRKQIGSILLKEPERLCSACRRYKDKICKYIGKIRYPDTVIYCSWWKEKLEKIIKTKRCSVCGEIKPISEFYKDKSSDDGHQYKCTKCAIEYSRNWQNENKTNIKSM